MTELRMEPYEIPAAQLGPKNPLPRFREKHSNLNIPVKESVPEEDRRYLGWQTAYRVLPYRRQDTWDRNKQPARLDSIVLENDILRAQFLVGLGGRIASLIHKPTGRELLDRNPVFQPADMALRGAWFTGGVEWNTGIRGHAYTTCSPLFAARIEGLNNVPVLRLYEWERVQRYPWQIDFYLPPGSPLLFVRTRIVNPHDHEIPMYWWTNIAVPERPGDRTVVPANTALYQNGVEDIHIVDIPVAKDMDLTYPGRVPISQHTFFRVPDERRHWITSLDPHGRGLVETSTSRLRGRKLFSWGMTPGGRHWQEFLAAPGSTYIEIQVGLSRTQEECIPMPAREHWTFTEAMGLLEADPAKVHGKNWPEACQCVETALEALIQEKDLKAMHDALEDVTLRAPSEILYYGSGWGALERRRLAAQKQTDRIPEELVFPEDSIGPDQQPWLELLPAGVFPERDPQEEPGSYMIQKEWCDLLNQSVTEGRSDHWLAWLHLGVMRMEAYDIKGAQQAWKESLARRPSAWAMRNLAVIEQQAAKEEAACDWMRQAWEIGPRIVQFAIEYAKMLADLGRYEELHILLEGLPGELKDNERLQIYAAVCALRVGDIEKVANLFKREFSTIHEGETILTDLWFEMHEKRISAKDGVPIDEKLRERVRREYPLPKNADFRQRTAIA